MKAVGRRVVFVLFSLVALNVTMTAALILSSVSAFAASQTFTGTVGDAMCGVEHVMPGDAVACTRGCTSKGSKYALVIGDKAYALDTTDRAVLNTLEKRTGERVIVTGTLTKNAITVTSVKAAR